MPIFDEIVAANRDYVEAGSHEPHPVRPSRQLAIVTCMDCRIDTFASLGLELGDAHVIRVAGARVTADVLRSLALSAHALGTRAVAVIGHTDCGVRDPDGSLVERLAQLMGHAPESREWYTFTDVRDAVRSDCALLLEWPDRPDEYTIAGYVLEIDTGALNEVVPPTPAPPPTS